MESTPATPAVDAALPTATAGKKRKLSRANTASSQAQGPAQPQGPKPKAPRGGKKVLFIA
jgi:hypothetical protein